MRNYQLLIGLIFSLVLLQGGKNALSSEDNLETTPTQGKTSVSGLASPRDASPNDGNKSDDVNILSSSRSASTVLRTGVSRFTSALNHAVSDEMVNYTKVGALAVVVGGISLIPPVLAGLSHRSEHLKLTSMVTNTAFTLVYYGLFLSSGLCIL